MYIGFMRFSLGPKPTFAWQPSLHQALIWCGGVLALVALVGCSHIPPSGVVHQPSIEPGGQVWHSADKAKKVRVKKAVPQAAKKEPAAKP